MADESISEIDRMDSSDPDVLVFHILITEPLNKLK